MEFIEPKEQVWLLHTQEVRGSSPCAPTIYSFRINSSLLGKNVQPDAFVQKSCAENGSVDARCVGKSLVGVPVELGQRLTHRAKLRLAVELEDLRVALP